MTLCYYIQQEIKRGREIVEKVFTTRRIHSYFFFFLFSFSFSPFYLLFFRCPAANHVSFLLSHFIIIPSFHLMNLEEKERQKELKREREKELKRERKQERGMKIGYKQNMYQESASFPLKVQPCIVLRF